jgi:hypothetical protein
MNNSKTISYVKKKKYNIMIKCWNNILIIISMLEYNLVLGYKNFRK